MEKVVIVVRGGVVQDVYSSNNHMEVKVIDFDDEEKSIDAEFEKETEGLEQVL